MTGAVRLSKRKSFKVVTTEKSSKLKFIITGLSLSKTRNSSMQSLYISSANALKFSQFTSCFLSALLILKIKQIIFLKKNGRNFGTQPIAFGGLFKIKKIDNKVKL